MRPSNPKGFFIRSVNTHIGTQIGELFHWKITMKQCKEKCRRSNLNFPIIDNYGQYYRFGQFEQLIKDLDSGES